MTWDIRLSNDFIYWYRRLSDDQLERVNTKVDLLAERGPALGEPHVALINISRERYADRIHNLKELRVGTIRVLFAFDPKRRAYLLVGGDKRGAWEEWYDEAIPRALDLWDEHLAYLATEEDE
jgi:hypothetical protein